MGEEVRDEVVADGQFKCIDLSEASISGTSRNESLERIMVVEW